MSKQNSKSTNLLFAIIPENLKGKTCLTCLHRERHSTGFSITQYCSVRHSNRTENKLLKIKCKNQACNKYKNQ